MKKLLIPILLFITTLLNAQDIQFITNGNINFATFELYKEYPHGKIYYFSDIKMNKNGYSEVYSEISGYYNIGKGFSVTGQYNAGLNKAFIIYPVYLAGFSKAFAFGDHYNLSIDVLYRHQNYLYLPDLEKHDGYQITPTFVFDFKKFQASGYLDFWNTKYYQFEPQAWYKLFKTLWIGAEWRISNYSDVLNYDFESNFIGNYANYIMGGIKWNI